MSERGLTTAPPEASSPPPGGGPHGDEWSGRPALRRGERERAYPRALRLGLLVSAVLHAALVLGISRWLHIGAIPYDVDAVRAPRPLSGLEVLEVRERTPDEEQAAEAETREVPAPRRERPPPSAPADRGEAVPAPARATGEDEGRGLTNRERLQPYEGDERLWEDFSDRPLPEYLPDRIAVAEGIIRSRLMSIMDSLQLSEEQRRRAREWLFGEGDDAWGITPEGIKLGDVVIPLDLGQLFAEEGPAGREARQEERDRLDIRRQDLLDDAEAVREERAEEMRRRSREEIARRDSAAAADTARSSPDEP